MRSSLRDIAEIAVILILVSGICVLSVVAVLKFLHFGFTGLPEDVRVVTGMDSRNTVDKVYISERDLQSLQETYSPAREKQWIASINESEVMTDLTLTGVGNLSYVSGEYDSSREPDVLIHSHRPHGTARLSDFDKEHLLNTSREELNRGERRELYRMSCILHRKWRFAKPLLYCYANPFYYEKAKAAQFSEGGLFNRVRVLALD